MVGLVIDEDDRDLGAAGHGGRLGLDLGAEAEHDQGGGAVGDQLLDVTNLQSLVVLRVAQGDLQPGGLGGVVDASSDRVAEGILGDRHGEAIV